MCQEFLEAIGHRDDPRVRLSTTEVTTLPLVSAAFFSGLSKPGSPWQRLLPLVSAVIVTMLGVGIVLKGLMSYVS